MNDGYDVYVDDLTIDYGAVRAVSGVTFGVKPGELVTLLGQSGCGKTSTLRAIAGLERNTGGRILIGGAAVSDAATRTFLPPERRDIGMVFQSYALWPHMTVAEAVGYPLRRRKVSARERAERVAKALAGVGMEDYGGRRVPELSGGQQQRVAIARALVYEPRILLLDEPLSNLDARLRERMRGEIKELQSRLGITTLYVTHDQTEALSMSHRIIVMQAGGIEQIGTPEELYANPRTRFASESLGRTIVLTACVISNGANGRMRVRLDGSEIDLEVAGSSETFAAGVTLTIAIRPERVEVATDAGGVNTFEAVVASRLFGGDHLQYQLAIQSHRISAKTDARRIFHEGDRVFVRLAPDDLTVVR